MCKLRRAMEDRVERMFAKHLLHQAAVAQVTLDGGQVRQRRVFVTLQVDVDDAMPFAQQTTLSERPQRSRMHP